MYNGHSQKDQKLVIKTNYRLMQVKSIAECSKGSILQYFQPSLTYISSLRSLFCLWPFYTCFTVISNIRVNKSMSVGKMICCGLAIVGTVEGLNGDIVCYVTAKIFLLAGNIKPFGFLKK